MVEELENKVLVKEEEEKVETEEKKPEEKREEEDKVASLLKKTRELLAEFNEAVNELARALESVDKRLDEGFKIIEKRLEEIEKKLPTVEEESKKREAQKYGKPEAPKVPVKDGFGGTLDVTPADLARQVPGEWLQKGGEVAETPRPEVINKAEYDDIVEKIYKGEVTLEEIRKFEKMFAGKLGKII